jgi:amino acid permease
VEVRKPMLIIFIVLAIIFFLIMIAGLILLRKSFKWEKVNGTYKYKSSESLTRRNGTQVKHREIGIQKMKGIMGSFSVKYQIPEFYQKLRSGDRKTIRFSLLLFGGIGFVLCIFLAIGTALIENGDSNGWLVIGFVIAFIILVVLLHAHSVKQSKKKD